MLNEKGNFSFLLGGLVFLVLVGIGAYYLGVSYQSSNTPKITATTSPSKDILDITNWTEYVNKKYTFSIKYPQSFKLGNYYAPSGELPKPNGNENKIGFYQNNDFFKNFFEVQVIESNRTLKQLVNENYQENTTHFKTKKSSELKQSVILGNPSYSYTFSGLALSTYQWNGLLSEENEYSVIFIQKDNIIYSFYYTNTDLFKKMYTTFVFTNSK